MNYYAHAHRFLLAGDVDPYFLAGTAVPDWLNVAHRRVRCRESHVAPFMRDDDLRIASLACGIAQHHRDDRWFHGTRTFTELSIDFAQTILRELGDARDLRAGFLGHVVVELLLDDHLIAANRSLLDTYYLAIDEVDATLVADEVTRMSGQPVPQLAEWIGRFIEVRFLSDYADDSRLCYRLNQVLHRVGLPVLPPRFAGLLPEFRSAIGAHHGELLTPD